MPGSSPDTTFIATIGYVRGMKIGHLTVWCYGKREGGLTCHHNKTMSIESLPDEMTLVSIEQRLRCEECGTPGRAEVRPDWSEITVQLDDAARGKEKSNEGDSGNRV
jgi:hypothetical protein